MRRSDLQALARASRETVEARAKVFGWSEPEDAVECVPDRMLNDLAACVGAPVRRGWHGSDRYRHFDFEGVRFFSVEVEL